MRLSCQGGTRSEPSVAMQVSTCQSHAAPSTGEEIAPEISQAVRAAGGATVTFGELSTTVRKTSVDI